MIDKNEQDDLDSLIIQILDVGQGDGIYILFPQMDNGSGEKIRRTMLVDLGTGRSKKKDGYENLPESVLKYFNENTRFRDNNHNAVLDYLVISHPHGDHYNLIGKFIEKFKPDIKHYLCGGVNLGSKTYENLLEKYDIITAVLKGKSKGKIEDEDAFGGIEVYVLAKDVHTKKVNHQINTSSVVLSLTDKRGTGTSGNKRKSGSLQPDATKRIILAGDATVETEEYILGSGRKNKLGCIALKVGHHGSLTSSCEDWIKATKPKNIFITADRHGNSDPDRNDSGARTGHRLPRQSTIDNFIKHNRDNFTQYQKEHGYVSHYDPKEYKSGNNPHRNIPPDDYTTNSRLKRNPKKHEWIELQTKMGIFTTLYHIGVPSIFRPLDWSDKGTQFELKLDKSGSFSVKVNDDYLVPDSGSRKSVRVT